MVELTKDQYIKLYYFMKLNRAVEDKLTFLYRQGKILGGLYRSLGQEAISVGAAYALEPEDFIAPLIRNLGAVLVKGFKPNEIFSQYMGRANSPTKGRDSATHLGDLKRGVIAPISMLGPMIPIMVGVALNFKMRKEKRIALTFIGDGGSSTGYFHEGINFAAVLNVPFILIMENNQFAYSTPVSKQTKVDRLSKRAVGYGIEGLTIDGNDVLKVYKTVKMMREKVLSEGGPVLIECLTMRMLGHAEHDDARYVPKELIEEWKKQDPISLYKNYLINSGILNVEEINSLDNKIERYIEEELAIAEAQPFPTPENELNDIYG